MSLKTFASSTALFAASAIAFVGVATAADMIVDAKPASRDIVTVAKESGRFNTLTLAIEAAGLTDTLVSQGSVTIFAPTDEAFAKLPPEQLEALLKPENRDQLVKILTYHVVPGAALEQDALKRRREAATAAGEDLPIALRNGRLRVGDARVSSRIEADNGVIHAIDRVLIPN
jgi:uncharacterized surface protein with fasciclin (FAS1) repeats